MISMNQFKNHKVDTLGRTVLSKELCLALGLKSGETNVSLTAVGSLVIMQSTNSGGCSIDHLGRIIIPKEIRQKFNWSDGSELEVYQTDSIAILKTA